MFGAPAVAAKPKKKTVSEKQLKRQIQQLSQQKTRLLGDDKRWLRWSEKDTLEFQRFGEHYMQLYSTSEENEHSLKRSGEGASTLAPQLPAKETIGFLNHLGEMGDIPAFMSYALMRLELLQQRQKVSKEVSTAELKRIEKEMKLLSEQLAAKSSKKGKKGSATEEVASTSETEKKLPEVVKIGLSGIFAFLAKAASDYPMLCVEPLRLMCQTVEGFAPQVCESNCKAHESPHIFTSGTIF